ncbi:hypothetical protein NQ317_009770 [Molorchus minor]|uniref:Uncharacterized protein n=1 Tax=Molorchus minor TaxID=1323400 RepID=A0ABQ9K0Y7_9CUCU|nr:hypothetical protein NQ317_009770 [Molorchus minor]
MFCVYFAILAIAVGGAKGGYAGSSASSGNELGQEEGPYGYGYSGSFSGAGPPPNFAFPIFDFSGFLGNYLQSLGRYHQEFLKKGGGTFSYSYSSASPTAAAKAKSSLIFKKNINRIQANTVGAAQGYGQPGGFSGGYGGSFGGGNGGAYGGSFAGPDEGSYSYPSAYDSGSGTYGGSFGGGSSRGAAASASFGPEGIQQTASVYPENPISPNINARFGGSTSGGPGFHSVFTSSSSHTSNSNGKPVTVQQATTTVNDNGKSYYLHCKKIRKNVQKGSVLYFIIFLNKT